jgi:outer membrane immunogenic protein
VLHFGDQILRRADYVGVGDSSRGGGNSKHISLKPSEQEPENAMKKLLQGTIGLVALGMAAAPAVAADLAARPYSKAPVMIPAAYDWSGFYLGINGGWGSSRKCWDLTNDGGVIVAPPSPAGCHDATGGTVGGQVGYRWQASSWVFGVEAQGNWADSKGSNTNLNFSTLGDRSKIDAFGLFTGQIGYAWNNVLFYVKGGGAVVSDRYNTFDIPSGLSFDAANETRWGGTVGAGLEFAFAPNWSFAVEYDHLFMGARNVDFHATGNFAAPAGTFSATDRIRQDVDLVTLRVNYRFGGPVIAKY